MTDWGGAKTVILIPHFFREGTTRQAFLLARELKARHIDVEVWTLFYSGECQKEFLKKGVPTRVLGFTRPRCPVIPVRAWHWATRLLRIAWRLRKERIQILLPMGNWPNLVAGLIYRLGGIRLCIWGERSSGADHVRMERLALRQYSSFIANSTAGVDFLTNEMGVARARISYIPNAVEQPKQASSSEWRTQLVIAPDQLLVVKVANIARFRDHATLIQAWKIVQDAWQGEVKPVLALAGAFGDSYRDVQRLWRDARLDTAVRFIGPVRNISSLIAAADLAVFSSRKEGMPNGVLECMAAGKAIVATDLPGIRDALGPNSGEVLVPTGDRDAFAARILDLLMDPTRRTSLGEANRTRALSEFTVARMVTAYLDLMEGGFRSRFKTKRRAVQTADESRSYSA
jgi:glycosyltransferase involved in cell wall biosynthesis